MNNWQEQTEYNELWMIDSDLQDPWFAYFDSLAQFELSRNRRTFKETEQPWIFSGSKFLPARMVFLSNFSDSAVITQQKIWRDLGSPKTVIYSATKNSFVKKMSAIEPEKFLHVVDLP